MMLAKTGHEQLWKRIDWKMAISLSNVLQGYQVFWSFLTENKKTLQYLHHQIVKYQSLDPEGFLSLSSPRFWGQNSFLVRNCQIEAVFTDFCYCRGRSGVLFQLNCWCQICSW